MKSGWWRGWPIRRTWLPALALGVLLACSGQASAATYTQAAHSGSWYGATSTASGGGGAYEDVAMSTSPGELVCASAWVRTQYPATGASGSFVIWLMGGSASEPGDATFADLSNLGNWTQLHTCAQATAAHSTLRVQFYPTPGSPVVDMDDIDVHPSLAGNGGFESGAASWSPYPNAGSNFAVYNGGAGTPAHSGSAFGATNASQGGGGIYQDISLSTSPGETICGSAWVRTEGSATGAAGAFTLWLINSAASDAGQATFSGLGNGTDWTEVYTCVEATASHTVLRIQFYPTPGTPTLEVDDVDVYQSLLSNGSFETGGSSWAPYPDTGSNFAVYQAGSPPARDGSHFGATNTAQGGGGIYQDVALNTSPGETICGSAWVRGEGAPATGQFVLWLTGGGGPSDAGDAPYTNVPTGGWIPLQTCVEATSSHTVLRAQFYPAPGSPTVEMDDVEAHGSAAVNGGFEYGSGPWGTYPNTDSSFDVYKNGVVTAPATPVNTKPVSTTLPRSRGRHALKIRLALSWTWRYAITRLEKASVGRFPHRTRLTVVCAGRGCSRHGRSAVGPKAVHRLLARLRGNRYRSGDKLRITFTARGWRAEQAEIVFRFGRLPLARLLGR